MSTNLRDQIKLAYEWDKVKARLHDWSRGKEHFEDVRYRMGELLEKNNKLTLDQVYDKAVKELE